MGQVRSFRGQIHISGKAKLSWCHIYCLLTLFSLSVSSHAPWKNGPHSLPVATLPPTTAPRLLFRVTNDLLLPNRMDCSSFLSYLIFQQRFLHATCFSLVAKAAQSSDFLPALKPPILWFCQFLLFHLISKC